MRVTDILSTANGNLRRSKLRTFLALVSISIGTFTLALSLGLGQGIRTYISSQLGQFENVNLYQVTKENGSPISTGFGNGDPKEYTGKQDFQRGGFEELFLDNNDFTTIQQTDGVQQLQKPYSANFDYLIGNDGVKYQAQNELRISQIPISLVAGSDIQKNDTGKIVISRKYAKITGAENTNDTVGRSLQFVYKNASGVSITEKFTVSGVFEPTLLQSPIYISALDSERIAKAQSPKGEPSFFFAYISKDTTLSDTTLKNNLSQNGYQAQSIADINNAINNVITGIQVGLAAFSAIAIIASVVGVINMLYMAVLERTREIGLLRALGAKRKTVFALFSLEATLLGFWGSVVGLVFAYIAQICINTVAQNTFLKGVEGLQLLQITPVFAFFITMTIAIVTLIAGILPALKASRLDPIEALRYE